MLNQNLSRVFGILFLLTNNFISFNDKAIILRSSFGTLFTYYSVSLKVLPE